jgi:hypothetical protein
MVRDGERDNVEQLLIWTRLLVYRAGHGRGGMVGEHKGCAVAPSDLPRCVHFPILCTSALCITHTSSSVSCAIDEKAGM